MKYSKKRRFGDYGEKVAVAYLKKYKYTIIETNVLRKWGEIDIVAHKGHTIHFVEVKTMSSQSNVSAYHNMTKSKLEKCIRSARMYVLENDYRGEYQIDGIFVTLKGLEIINCEYVQHISH